MIAIAYQVDVTAKLALAKLEGPQKEQLISIDDAVIATHRGDEIHLDQAMSLIGAGAAGGAFWGGHFGPLFLMPLAGMAIGAASGAIASKISDYGIDDRFAKEMGAKVSPGKAGLGRPGAPDRVVSEMKRENFGGEIIRTNLSEEDEAKLKAAATAS